MIGPTSEKLVLGRLTFHLLGEIISAACSLIAILMSFYLMWMHALHYTKPTEQKQIIRILFMVPVYSAASLLSYHYYYHAIYFQVICDCYEAFAISSFFALMCSYIDVDLHEQKNFFRQLRGIKPWVAPINWFKKCCGGERGPWRTPKSGLTWFNIIWIGIYHYCFIRVTMTVTAVVTQYYGRYCESSDSPVFSHIWILVIESVAVTIAMYCLIQFYIQLRVPLADHQPFLKVLAIKLVIFLSFWQSTMISLGTSTFNIVHATETIAYPDIKVGIPSMLLCIEMAIFSVMHLWAFPYRPYLETSPVTYYPTIDSDSPDSVPKRNERQPPSGGFMGLRAFYEAANIWDVIKAFGRGIRWLFVGIRRRREDVSYQTPYKSAEMDMDDLSPARFNSRRGKNGGNGGVVGGNVNTEYMQQTPDGSNSLNSYGNNNADGVYGMRGGERGGAFGIMTSSAATRGVPGGGSSGSSSNGSSSSSNGEDMPKASGGNNRRQLSDEAAGLIAYAQPMSSQTNSPERYRDGREGSTGGVGYSPYDDGYSRGRSGTGSSSLQAGTNWERQAL